MMMVLLKKRKKVGNLENNISKSRKIENIKISIFQSTFLMRT